VNWALIAILLIAQIQTGEIRLQVNDATGTGMEASGTLESLAAGISREFETDAQGVHRFGALPFGVYRLEVERAGFSKQTVLLDVRSQIPVMHTATMVIIPVESSVEIREEATLIDPTNAISRTSGSGSAELPCQLRPGAQLHYSIETSFLNQPQITRITRMKSA
jgi:hypothetical protein